MRWLVAGALALVAAALYWALMPGDLSGPNGVGATDDRAGPGAGEGARGAQVKKGRVTLAANAAKSATEAPLIAPRPGDPIAAKNVRTPSPAQLRARLAMQMKQGLEGGQPLPQEDGTPTGALSKESVKAGIDEARPAVAKCYEEALVGNPDLTGKLVLRFTIVAEDGEGRLRDAAVVDDGLGNPFLGMCAIEAIAKISFEVPEGGGEVIVNYPFVLAPAADVPEGAEVPPAEPEAPEGEVPAGDGDEVVEGAVEAPPGDVIAEEPPDPDAPAEEPESK